MGIDQFRRDLMAIMTSPPSWDRHWGRNKGPLSADKGDIVVFAFNENNEWYAVGDAVVLYDGISEGLEECKERSGTAWKACYHFENFRLYSRSIPYSELKASFSKFNPNARQLAQIDGDDYLRLLSLTVQ